MKDALTITKVLMRKGVEGQRANTRDGNMIVNKLLYFAQLISLSKYDQKLFLNDIYAFQDGCVVEDVRSNYHTNYKDLLAESSLIDTEMLSPEEKDVIDETIKIFGDFSAGELSEITHGHKSWIEKYEGSKVGSFHYKSSQKISTESLIENEVPWISDFLIEEDDDGYEAITNEGTIFYYNPEVYTEEEAALITSGFKGIDNVYTLVKDFDGKAVIY